MLILDYVIPILSLLLGIALLGVSVYALVKIAATFRGIIQEIKDFFSPQAESQLSAFGEVISFIAKAIGIQVAQSFNQVIAGSIGGTVKGANAELQEQFAKSSSQRIIQRQLCKWHLTICYQNLTKKIKLPNLC